MGKAQCLLHQFIIFVNTVDLLDEIRESFKLEQDEMAVGIEAIAAQVDLLVLDDIGAERVTDWVLERLYKLVNRRYMDCCSTIVTTNLDEQKLSDRVSYPLVSRLYEMCPKQCPFKGEDYRKKYAGKK